eukprot:scaffold4384_cov183-Skeletonema_marinoi.AAC.4
MPCFTWTVTGKSVNARYNYKDYLDPSVIRGNMTQFEIEAFLSIQTLVRPNNWAFIGGVLGRTANDCKTAWGSVKKPLLATPTLESLTGRTELTVGEKYDFGSQDVMAKCSQAVLKSYMKKHPTPSNDPRIRTPSSLTKETIASLAREQNLKNAKAKKNTAKKKVCGEKTAERASKRAKKTENAQAVLKTEEEVKQLESKDERRIGSKRRRALAKKFLLLVILHNPWMI